MISTVEWIEKARYYHGERYDYSEADYRGAGKRIRVICPKHGPWRTVASQHASLSAHHGCSKCRNLISDIEWLRRFREKHGDEYDYSSCDFQDGGSRVEIVCNKHGSFHVLPRNHASSAGGGRCPDCDRLESRERFLERAKATHGDRYDYSLIDFETIHNKVEITCTEHGTFWQTPHNHELGHGCRKCVLRGRHQHR